MSPQLPARPSLEHLRNEAKQRLETLRRDGRDTIALHVLVAEQKADAVRWLIAHGVDINAKRRLWDCNQTALHVTAEHGLTVLGWAE